MRSEIFRSTPFRLTLILGTAFVVALMVAALIAFSLIQNELSARMDRSIADTMKVITESYGDADQIDLVDSVRSHSNATIGHERIFGLAGPDGSLLAGNVASLPAGDGWSNLSAEALGLGSIVRDTFRVVVSQVGQSRLLVGASFSESAELVRIATVSFGWACVAILSLVVAVGIVIALRAQRRIDGIAATMSQVGHGQLGARILVSSRGDDIDVLAQQVNAALERLEQLVEGMRHVSVNIAHDLKTPLHRLAMTLERAASDEEAGRPVGDALVEATIEIQELNATFDALLRIAQIESGARRARFVSVQLGAVLDRIADAYTDVAEERGQVLTIKRDAALPEMDGDHDLLTQLCANLVENSMRHCPAGTVIMIEADVAADKIVVAFSDNGPGIPSDEYTKVFQRLYRVDKSRTTAGNGLGLSLVKAVADLHGAIIDIGDNTPGLKLTVTFPVGQTKLQPLTNP